MDKLLDLREISRKAYIWLSKHKTKAFYSGIMAQSLRTGVQSLLQVSFSNWNVLLVTLIIFASIATGFDGIRYIYTLEIVKYLTLHIKNFQSVGLGKLRPNMLLLGFKSDWHKASPEEVCDYFRIIQLVHFYYFS